MTPTELYNDIQSYCLQHSNEDNVKKYQRFFKDNYNAYGLTSKEVQERAKLLSKDNNITLQVALDAMPMLMQSGKYEEVSINMLLIDAHHKQFTPETLNAIASWFPHSINNWAHADTLGMSILPKFLNKNIVNLEAFASWITSPYKFQRRCVPVTLIKSLKHAETFDHLFAFTESLVNDREREVHQGMGWFMREAWKLRREETEAFLLKWKETAPRLIIQYACEKMTADEKLRFKRNNQKK